MAVWLDRKSPRDLYDLWALGTLDLIDAEALDLFKLFGPTGKSPTPSMFADPPSEPQWENLLNHQGLTKIGPTEAAASVESWWASIYGVPLYREASWQLYRFARPRQILLDMGRNRSGSYPLLPRPGRKPATPTTESTVTGTTAIILRQPS